MRSVGVRSDHHAAMACLAHELLNRTISACNAGAGLEGLAASGAEYRIGALLDLCSDLRGFISRVSNRRIYRWGVGQDASPENRSQSLDVPAFRTATAVRSGAKVGGEGLLAPAALLSGPSVVSRPAIFVVLTWFHRISRWQGGTEGRGLEPRWDCSRRFSRPLPYQLGLALPAGKLMHHKKLPNMPTRWSDRGSRRRLRTVHRSSSSHGSLTEASPRR